jgi:hypothetical protein
MSAPFLMRRVKDDFEHTFSAGRNQVRVPAGARVVRGPDNRLWVDHNVFPVGIDRHDAEYYGIPVSSENIIVEAV